MNDNVKYLLNELERELNNVPESYKIFNAKRSIKDIRKNLDIKASDFKEPVTEDIMDTYVGWINEVDKVKNPHFAKWKDKEVKESKGDWWKLGDNEDAVDEAKIDDILQKRKDILTKMTKEADDKFAETMTSMMEKACSDAELKRVSEQMSKWGENHETEKQAKKTKPVPIPMGKFTSNPQDIFSTLGNPPE